jgi:hypothetical protein
MMDDGDCGAIGGMKIGRVNRNTWRKHASAPQILYDVIWNRNRAAAALTDALTILY